jgi:hypothetical protein
MLSVGAVGNLLDPERVVQHLDVDPQLVHVADAEVGARQLARPLVGIQIAAGLRR